MGVNQFILIIGITSLFSCVLTQSSTNEENLKALCGRYKFLWSDKDPEVFYYCFTNKAAVQLKCKSGYYMCKREGMAFHPCDCKHGEENGNTISQGQSGEAASGEYGSKGCPDPFMRYENYHRFGGEKMEQHRTLALCQGECMKNPKCIGIDWSMEEKDQPICFIMTKKGYTLAPKANVDHYMRTTCSGNYGVTPASNQIENTETDLSDLPRYYNPAYPTAEPATGSDFDNKFDRKELDEFLNALGGRDTPEGKQATTAAPTPASMTVPPSPIPSSGGSPSGAGSSASGSSSSSGSSGSGSSNSGGNNMDTTLTTDSNGNLDNVMIGDNGCPDPFQKYVNRNQHGGINKTKDGLYDTAEECKFLCLVSYWCKGVDFDTNTNTCYLHREINDDLQMDTSGVTLYVKHHCGRPLTCWKMYGLTSVHDNLAITRNDQAEKVTCRGVCFTTRDSAEGKIQRGCYEDASQIRFPEEKCFLNDAQSLTCQCVTGLCNGITVDAQMSLLLHLPFDGTLEDKSSFRRDGRVPDGFEEPRFSSMQAHLNMSAIFSGRECVEVASLANIGYGPTGVDGTTVPEFSVSFAMFRFPGGSGEKIIMQNSEDPDVPSSLNIVGRGDSPNFVKMGVSTELNPGDNEDLNAVRANANMWKHIIMTYNGNDILENEKPFLTGYVDGVEVRGGNKMDDLGNIQVRGNSLMIGCNKNDPNTAFEGILDEVMLFQMELTADDVNALQQITEHNILESYH